MGLFTALSIFVHNFPEGLATFVRRRTTALLSCYLGAISARGEARRIMLIHQLSRSAGPVLSSGPDHDTSAIACILAGGHAGGSARGRRAGLRRGAAQHP